MPTAKQSRKKSYSTSRVSQKKSVRSQRGVAETNYGEIKKISSFSLTPTALNLLKNLSQDLNISMSEVLERFARLGTELKDSLSQEVLLQNAAPESSKALHKP